MHDEAGFEAGQLGHNPLLDVDSKWLKHSLTCCPVTPAPSDLIVRILISIFDTSKIQLLVKVKIFVKYKEIVIL